MTTRRRFIGSFAALPAFASSKAITAQAQPVAPAGERVIRYALPAAETGFDPAQISDLYSRYITAHIFESLLIYDFMARPVKVKPLVADAMPEVSADFRTYTFRVRPGIYFHDDPVFAGRPRELTAQDFVYSLKRFWDPRWKSPQLSTLDEFKFTGMSELRRRALHDKTPFPYDVEVEGLRALDRYTLRLRLDEPAPHLSERMAWTDLFGAVAREAVEAYADDLMAHPIGTGPFRLAHWRRSSRIVLERNRNYRELVFDDADVPAAAQAQRLAKGLRGRRLPLVDRVEVYIVEESQPRWLAFLNAEHDLIDRVPNDFVNIAVPGGKLSPSLTRRGVQLNRVLNADVTYTVFNMKHPVIGGYTPEKVALRRAIALGMDIDKEIRIPRRNQAVRAQAPINPHTYGHDPALKTEMGDYDLARAKALLDMFGYIDRDGDGWRELPDGAPLVLEYATSPDQSIRQLDEVTKENINALGLRLEFKFAQWPENLKQARAAKFMLWGVGSTAASYDCQPGLQRGYSGAAGGANLAHFAHRDFDRIYDEMRVTPNGPRRLALISQAVKLWIAYMPYKTHVSRILTDMWHPWVNGYVRHPFMLRFWDHLDIDEDAKTQSL